MWARGLQNMTKTKSPCSKLIECLLELCQSARMAPGLYCWTVWIWDPLQTVLAPAQANFGQDPGLILEERALDRLLQVPLPVQALHLFSFLRFEGEAHSPVRLATMSWPGHLGPGDQRSWHDCVHSQALWPASPG